MLESDNFPPLRPLVGCPSLTSECIFSLPPLLASPLPLALGAGLESNPAAAASRTEAGAWAGHWGSELSQRICPEDSACALSSAGKGGPHFHLLEEEGHSTRWAFHSPNSQPPVPTKACQPVQVNAFLTVLSLSMGSGQGQSTPQWLGSWAPTVSLKPYSLGSHASLPFPPSPVQEQECPHMSSPDPLPSSMGTASLQQQGTSAKSPVSRN